MNASVDIVSVGMVTAVGLDAPSSCAAMRAKLDGFQETRFLGPRGGWLTGAPVQLPRGWIGEKRIAHLAAGAIVEAFNHAPGARGQTSLILCIGEEDRPGIPFATSPICCGAIAGMVEVEAYSRSRVVAHGRPPGMWRSNRRVVCWHRARRRMS